MSEKTVAVLLREITDVAILPEVMIKISQVLVDPNTDVADLCDIFQKDPALSTRLLKLANSAFYGFPGRILNVERAIVLLGTAAVKALAMTCAISPVFASDVGPAGFSPKQLWTHSLAVGVIVRRVLKAMGHQQTELGFLIGAIHDLGLLLEFQCREEAFGEILVAAGDADVPFPEIERRFLDTDHGELGLAVARQWGFPALLANVLGSHHTPLEADREFWPHTCAVAVADRIAIDLSLGFADVTVVDETPSEAWELLELAPDRLDHISEGLAEELGSIRAVLGV
jgi:HD-like signal output (HDOD) protein